MPYIDPANAPFFFGDFRQSVSNGGDVGIAPTDIPEVHGTFERADRVVRPYEEQCVFNGGKKLDRLSPGQRPGLLWDLEEGVQYDFRLDSARRNGDRREREGRLFGGRWHSGRQNRGGRGAIGRAGRSTLDVTGRLVTPGFIDIHRHADAALFREGFGDAELFQGLTTIVNGNCGLSIARAAARFKRIFSTI